jgi:hypothetical protein
MGSEIPAPDEQRPDQPRAAGWFSDRGRALVIPLAAMVAVVLLVAMSMVWPVDGQVVTAAVVGVLTLASVLAGHAAGSSRRTG